MKPHSRSLGENLARKRHGIVLLSGLLLWPLSLRALDPAKSVFQFNCQNWSRQSGLPADKVNDVTQTNDGYIWLGTQHGLVRFDGLDFKVVPIDLPQAQGEDVKKLSKANGGGLWFAINEGGYGGFDGQKFLPVGDGPWSTFDLNPNTIVETREGDIWTGGKLSFGRWNRGNPGKTFLNPPRIGEVLSLCEDPAGRVWLGTAEGGLYYWADGVLGKAPDISLTKHNIFALAAEADGRIWVGTEKGVQCYDANGSATISPPIQSVIRALLVDRHGVLWIGTTGMGLARYDHGKLTYLRKADGLGSDYVLSLFEDAEGSLWIGTRDGLSQLTDVAFPIVSSKEGILDGSTHGVAASQKGGLWISTTVGVSYFDGATAKNFVGAMLPSNQWTNAIFEASTGDVYVVDGDKNVAVLAGDRISALYPNTGWPTAFAEDSKSVLVAVADTLYRFENGRLRPYEYKAGQRIPIAWIHNLCVAKDGAIWLACDNQIVRLQDGSSQQWSIQIGRSGNKAQWIFEDQDGAIWAGLTVGMARIKLGQIKFLRRENRITEDRIYAIVPDDLGFFWIASARGLSRVARQDLNDLVDGKSSRLPVERFNGLESVKFTDHTDQAFSGCKTLDGRIWFPNPQGVVMIDPAHYFTNKVIPPVHIQTVKVNGRELPPARSAVLSAAGGRLEFSFAALSYIAPKKVEVRYQLVGFDPGWIEAEGRRTVVYGNLPPGHYRFLVQAANANGVWNTAGDEFGIELPPPYYRTGWFYGLTGLVGVLGIFGIYRWTANRVKMRQQRLQTENDLLEARVSQRTHELANSLSLLNATLESTTDGIVAVDLSDQIVSYNSKFAAIWHFPPGLLERRNAAESRNHTARLVGDPAAFFELTRKVNTNPEKESFAIIQLKDGRTFERYVFPQRIDGQCVGTVINWRDITERKRGEETLRESEEKFRLLANNISDVFWIRSPDMKVLHYLSAGFELIWGRPVGDLRANPHTWTEAIVPEDRGRVTAVYATLMANAPQISVEYRITRPDASIRWVHARGFQVHDAGGKLVRLTGIVTDITDRKQGEEMFQRQRTELRVLFDLMPAMVWFRDAANRILRINQRAADAVGKSIAEIEGRPSIEIYPQDAARFYADDLEVINSGAPRLGYVESMRDAKGNERWVQTDKVPFRGPDGEVSGIVVMAQDITERRLAEESLRLLSSAVGQSAESIMITDAQLDRPGPRIVFVNQAYTTMTGYSQEETLGQTPRIMQGPHTDRTVLDRLRRNLSRGEDFSGIAINYRKDGSEFSLEWQIAPIRNSGGIITHFLAIQRDVTERMRAKDELSWKTALLEAQMESYAVGVLVVDNQGKKILQNHRTAELWKIPPEIVDGSDDQTQVRFIVSRTRHPEKFGDKVAYLYDHPDESSVDEVELIDGTFLERHSAPVIGKDGTRYGRIWTFADVTARKQAEVELAYERDLLRSLLDSSPDQIYFKDAQSRFIKCSAAQAANFGATGTGELVGKTDFDYFATAHASAALEDERKIMRTGQSITNLIENEVWKDGRETWALTSKMPLLNKAGEIIGTFGISKDITPIKKAEAELAQLHQRLVDASRLAGMAEVATGVLHNVGNVLNSVNVSATLVADHVRHSKSVNVAKICVLLNQHKADIGAFLTTDPKGMIIPAYLDTLAESLTQERTTVIGELENLRKNIEHIKDIVAMQQNYAKNSGFTETVSLPDLIEDALRMNAGSLARHDVNLVRDYAARPVVTLDRHKVMQILINLIRNAKYACDESGRVDKLITIRTSTTEHSVRVAVIDNGVGIPPENLTQIFSHGFTTRKSGHGFGLHSGALAAKEMGGSLVVLSAGPGQGATFTLELPYKPETPPHAQPAV